MADPTNEQAQRLVPERDYVCHRYDGHRHVSRADHSGRQDGNPWHRQRLRLLPRGSRRARSCGVILSLLSCVVGGHASSTVFCRRRSSANPAAAAAISRNTTAHTQALDAGG